MIRWFLVRIAALVGALASASVVTQGAQFKVEFDPRRSCSSIEVSGEIKPGDFGAFQGALKKATSVAAVRRIVLDSQGGEFVTAAAIWQALRSLKLPVQTVVNARRQCSSTCVLILAAGNEPYVNSDATVVIHQARNIETGKPSLLATLTFGYYLVESGFSPKIIQTFQGLREGQDLQISPSNAGRYHFDKLRFFGSTDPPAVMGCSWKGFLPKR